MRRLRAKMVEVSSNWEDLRAASHGNPLAVQLNFISEAPNLFILYLKALYRLERDFSHYEQHLGTVKRVNSLGWQETSQHNQTSDIYKHVHML